MNKLMKLDFVSMFLGLRDDIMVWSKRDELIDVNDAFGFEWMIFLAFVSMLKYDTAQKWRT